MSFSDVRNILLTSQKSRVWLVGDSSLDNKACINSDLDVCHHLTNYCGEYTVINMAIGGSTLKERDQLPDQDEFVRDNMNPDDILIISVGGIDIGQKQDMATLTSFAKLITKSPEKIIKSKSFEKIKRIFNEDTKRYITKLTDRIIPEKILVCSPYFPCLYGKGSYDFILSIIGYKNNPKRIHKIIESIYESATSKITMRGMNIIPIETYSALDYTNGKHYVECVTPSILGGEVLAKYLADSF